MERRRKAVVVEGVGAVVWTCWKLESGEWVVDEIVRRAGRQVRPLVDR